MYAISAAIGALNGILLVTTFCRGFCIGVGELCAIAFGSLFYPAGLRGLGVAWAYGVGRLGAAGGTYIAGVFYANNRSADAMFRASAASVFVAAVCVALMGARYTPERKILVASASNNA